MVPWMANQGRESERLRRLQDGIQEKSEIRDSVSRQPQGVRLCLLSRQCGHLGRRIVVMQQQTSQTLNVHL
jgi:hypothetical protein